MERAFAAVHVRGLFLKGPSVAAFGLLPKHRSKDVDVLVAPDALAAASSILEALGFKGVERPAGNAVLPPHSLEFSHPTWPCELDVHFMLPGSCIAPSELFETLWQKRCQLEVANVDISFLDRTSLIVLMLTQFVRDGELDWKSRAPELSAKWRQSLGISETAIRASASTMGLSYPLSLALGEVSQNLPSKSGIEHAWKARARLVRGTPGSGFLYQVQVAENRQILTAFCKATQSATYGLIEADGLSEKARYALAAVRVSVVSLFRIATRRLRRRRKSWKH